MLVLKMPPRLYVFRFDIAVHLTTYLHRAILIIYPNYYIIKFLPLQQALLKRGKPTYLNLPVFKHYRVSK